MIKYLKQYIDKTFEELVNSLIWFDNPFKLKAIFAKLYDLILLNSPKYKVYIALLNQTGTNAPIPTVLENTLGGDIVWSYSDLGEYVGTLTNAFVSDKTYVKIGMVSDGDYSTYYFGNFYVIDTNSVGITVLDSVLAKGDNLLNNTPVEIRVYL